MAESIFVNSQADKKSRYEELIPQIKALCTDETDRIANLSNLIAALKYGMDFFWVGFYEVKENQLVLSVFQGPPACTRITFNRGVCGACYREKRTILVADVEQFPGHIACSSASKSEIVVPVLKDSEVIMLLDVDSDKLNDFDHIDQKYLEELMAWVAQKF